VNSNKETSTRIRGERTLGLLPSPGHCERVAEDIVDSLSERLNQEIDPDLSWSVEIIADPLTGSNVAMSEVLEEIKTRKLSNSWDYAISLTDVPIRREDRIVIGQTGGGLDVAVISVPALGAIRLRPHVLTMILELMDDLYRGTTHEDEPARFVHGEDAYRGLSTDEDADGDLRYTSPPVRGHIRLLTGMVYANRPWRLFPSFKTAVATAFATGGYGLIFTSLWEIGNVYGYPRLIVLMFAAMTILATWIIISHNLWERNREGVTPYVRRLYNTTTVLTIAAGVVFSYAIIFILLLLAAGIYIPTSMLESTLGRPVSWINFVKIAWVTASVATIAGAIGAGLEDSEEVRNATFGWRQSNRWTQHQERED
jgi:hypothetical protein